MDVFIEHHQVRRPALRQQARPVRLVRSVRREMSARRDLEVFREQQALLARLALWGLKA